MGLWRKVTLIVGLPGAKINKLAFRLRREKQYSVLWPNQNIDVVDGERFYELNSQNIEVHNIHKSILDKFTCSDNLFRTGYPSVTEDDVFPGPKEFLSKFRWGESVLITDNLLVPFLNLWLPHANKVYFVSSSKEEDLASLDAWTMGTKLTAYLEDVRECFQYKLNSALTHSWIKPIPVRNEDVSTISL
ncbi:MAG: hypothetical protein EHM87_20130 [Burkholderiales bacterium]|nr:MAG: hypothetical protein EHM87_20130 [Burkholderiales bacterium]